MSNPSSLHPPIRPSPNPHLTHASAAGSALAGGAIPLARHLHRVLSSTSPPDLTTPSPLSRWLHRSGILSAGTRAAAAGRSRRCSLLATPLARVPRRGSVAALRQARSSASAWQERRCHGPISLLLRSSKAVVRPCTCRSASSAIKLSPGRVRRRGSSDPITSPILGSTVS